MLLNEHKRWNQWAIFFLAPLGLLLASGFNERALDFIGEKLIWFSVFILGVGWTISVYAIKRSTSAWSETIEKIDSDESRKAWTTYKQAIKSFNVSKDLSRRILTVTNVLFVYGIGVALVGLINLLLLLACCCCK